MKKRYYILFGGLILVFVAYFSYPDLFPPRTPLKVARLTSGLDISKELKFEMLQDDWAPNGDGTTLVRAKVSDKELSELIRQAIEKNYKRLPIKESSPDLSIPIGIADGMNGYYYLKQDNDDPRDYTITIIDTEKKEISAYIDYM